VIAPAFLRPVETEVLVGNPAKARRVLGWSPQVGFEDLIRQMIDADMKWVQDHGS
jgi:GDPmannose 4,6-dehydratase